ncbi:hypothetical protein [Solibacillus sp. FSL H8-0538]|uniref:hypothetical protein n=1 Tax=Solibacillus sp. FSL H8-0538 TaxID=2921400 RepID=UPI0030FD0CF9
MKTIYYTSRDPVVVFAVNELASQLQQERIVPLEQWGKVQETEHTEIFLLTMKEYVAYFAGEPITLSVDEYTIIQENHRYYITGNTPRALLYGVYGFWQHVLGVVALYYDELAIKVGDNTLEVATRRVITQKPKFRRRGNVLETLNDVEFLQHLVDWGVKNGHNEYFFTFFLWDEVKDVLEPELAKRGVNVTLGGHSLRYLLAKLENEQRLSSQAIDGAVGDLVGEKTAFTQQFTIENGQFFTPNNPLQQRVIKDIVAICQDAPMITRISLWPEDIGIDAEQSEQFLTQYIAFTDQLKLALLDKGLSVEVEHIVYNAGLAWHMLERADHKPSEQSDILFAYWGRDYSRGLADSGNAGQRALSALQHWKASSTKEVTIFEYYSDHFMLSELFPPLHNRIAQDIAQYEQLQCEGILNLIVPLHKQTAAEPHMSSYNYQWNQHWNNAFYSRLAWGEDFAVIEQQMFAQFNDAVRYKQLLDTLETELARHTNWNFPLFPSRVVDVKKIDSSEYAAIISQQLHRAHEVVKDFTEEPLHPQTVQEKMDSYFFIMQRLTKLYAEAWAQKVGEASV